MNGPNPDVDAREANTDQPLECDLRAILVRYEGGADRRTVYPDEADDLERMTRWFTADDDAFVPLDECR
jgi:hypothetical protein